jgi:hypothetical protein
VVNEGKRRSRAPGLPTGVVAAALDELRRAVKAEARRVLGFGIEPGIVRSAVARGFRDAMAKLRRRQRDRPAIHEKRARISE